VDHLTDAELWLRGCDGDHAAAGELFRRHAQAVFVFLVRRTGDRELAEDLTSTVFLEAWRKRRDVVIQGESALPWLYGVALNCARNARRSLQRHRAALGRLALERPLPGSLEEASELRRVLELLRRLPEDQRDVVVACAWTGLSYEDAALALGISVGTVRSRLSRARTRLAKLEADRGRPANPTPIAQSVRPSHEP
jgi:RNA polymerase sigma factor (sigma-70 family)